MIQFLHKNRRAMATLLLVLLMNCVFVGVASACPNCKDTLGHDNQARGYYYSILFMLAMPATILSAFSFAAYRAVNKAKQEQEAAKLLQQDNLKSDEIDAAAGE
jgi:hypothetical protein